MTMQTLLLRFYDTNEEILKHILEISEFKLLCMSVDLIYAHGTLIDIK